MRLRLSYIRLVLTYACTTLEATRDDEQKLCVFKKKILGKIYEPYSTVWD